MHALCEPEHIDRAHHVRLNGFDRIVLVMDRRRRTGEIVDLIDLEQYRLRSRRAVTSSNDDCRAGRDVLLSAR